MSIPGPSFADVISAISDDLVARLSGWSYPSLAGAAVLFGRDKVWQEQAPPRIVAVPKGGPYDARDAANSSTRTDSPLDNRNVAAVLRPLWSVWAEAEMHFWGEDYAHSEFLRRQFIWSAQRVTPGVFRLGAERWNEETNVVVAGQDLIATISWRLPIYADAAGPDTQSQYEASARAPTDTTVSHTGEILFPWGTTATSCCGLP